MHIYINKATKTQLLLIEILLTTIISVAREVNICQPLSPVCWRMWLTRCSFLVNDLEQKPHRCGDSPVCWRTWFRRCSFRVNVFEQKSQRCGVSPVCHIMWFVKCSFLVNDLPAYGSIKQKEKHQEQVHFIRLQMQGAGSVYMIDALQIARLGRFQDEREGITQLILYY